MLERESIAQAGHDDIPRFVVEGPHILSCHHPSHSEFTVVL